MSQSIAITDANLFWSPYGWYFSGSTYALSNAPGNYFKCSFTGTSLALSIDQTNLISNSTIAGGYPVLRYRIDGGSWVRYVTLSTDTSIVLATGLSAGTHTAEVWYAASLGALTTPDRFDPTTNENIKLTGLTLDTAASLVAPTLRPHRMIVYGDSNTEGKEDLTVTGSDLGNQDASQTYGALLAASLNAEVGIIGMAQQAYTGGANQLDNKWDKYFTGLSRLSSGLFSPAPDYILVNHGINDGSSPQATVTSLIGAWRTAAPLAIIFVTVPWNGTWASQIGVGVAAQTDTNTFYINTGVTSYNSLASPHMSVAGHAAYAADLLPLLQAHLPTPPSTGGVSRSRLQLCM